MRQTDETPVPFIGIKELMKLKKAAAGPRDLLDPEKLALFSVHAGSIKKPNAKVMARKASAKQKKKT